MIKFFLSQAYELYLRLLVEAPQQKVLGKMFVGLIMVLTPVVGGLQILFGDDDLLTIAVMSGLSTFLGVVYFRIKAYDDTVYDTLRAFIYGVALLALSAQGILMALTSTGVLS